jgi:hypothetical protein
MTILYLSLGVFYKKKNSDLLYITLFVFGIIAVILSVTLIIEYTESDGFCADYCHPMAEYGESLQDAEENTTLAVHREESVGCADCHNPPGVQGVVESKFAAVKEVYLYVTFQYPDELHHPEMETKFCAKSGCHDEADLLIEGVKTNETSTGIVEHPEFDDIELCNECHAPHQEGLKWKPEGCVLCHNSTTVENLDDHEDFLLDDDAYLGIIGEDANIATDPGSCNDCHADMEPIPYAETTPNEFCESCHEDEFTAYTENSTATQTAMYGNCYDCHEEHKEKKELHPVLDEVDCEVCHTTYDADVTIHNPSEISYLEVASDLDSEFCADCHKDQYGAYTENATMEQLEFYGDCADCHTDHDETREIHPGLEEIDCQNCHLNYDEDVTSHDPSGISYASEKDRVKNEFCSDCHSGQFNAYSGNTSEAQKATYGANCVDCHSDHDEVRDVHSMPGELNCWSCHLNYDDEIGSHDPSSISYRSVSGQLDDGFCDGCHGDIYDTYYQNADENKDRLRFYGDCLECHSDHAVKDLPHSSDAQYQECGDCHSSYDEDLRAHTLNDANYGSMDLPNEFCGSCHEEIATGFKAGDIRDQSCVDCHSDHTINIVTPADSCGTCHENFRKDHNP